VREQNGEGAMSRRVTDGPGDELRRQAEDLRRRTNWENPASSVPDPDWEGGAGRPVDPLRELRELVSAVIRRGRPHRG
jgi:hypothetical protein